MVPFPCQAVNDAWKQNIEKLVLRSYLGIFIFHVCDKL